MADAARCDNCSTHADRPGTSYYHSGPTSSPAGWVRLNGRRSTGSDFDAAIASDVMIETCSWRCAAEWVVKYANEQEATIR